MSAGGDNFDAGGDTIESVIIFRIDGRTIKRGALIRQLDHLVPLGVEILANIAF